MCNSEIVRSCRGVLFACVISVCLCEAYCISGMIPHQGFHEGKVSTELFKRSLSLRGGQRTKGVVDDILASAAAGPEGGEWLFASAQNEHGDEFTILFHTNSGVCMEIDHEYSDGGVTFSRTRGGPVQVYTSNNEIAESQTGFASPQLTCALSTGDLRHASRLAGMGESLGDWRRERDGVLSNSFFGSRVLLTRSGGFLFLSNRLANKAFLVDGGVLQWLGYQEALELVNEIGL